MVNSQIALRDSAPDAVSVWNECLENIKPLVPVMTFNTWFVPIKPIALAGDTLTIQLPNNFFYDWIAERYNSFIAKSIKEVLGEQGVIKYVVMNEELKEPEVTEPQLTSKITMDPSSLSQETTDEADGSEPVESNINPKYTFENFIKGESNQLARAAAYAIGENPGGTSFNPLFIYGGVGLGKTHLIQAIGNAVLQNNRRKKVHYISADRFTLDFVQSIQYNKKQEFTNRFKKLDVLIIDDIHGLSGKERTLDEFFFIFNTLHQAGKQIVLTSDRPPNELTGISDRLISRFNWGLTTDIQPPDFETRMAILNDKADNYGIKLTGEMYDYIATHITSNIRELEGVLLKLLAKISFGFKDITFEMVKKIVKEISTTKKVIIGIDVITKVVCEHMRIDEKKIRDKTRKKEIAEARQIAMYLSKMMTNSTLKMIGLHFGGRDHSTVIHAITETEHRVNTEKRTKDMIEEIQNKIELLCS
ncbi:MAG: chromosomal replication initiator protein DnaA [Ignavibacteriales bacterium]|nr:MAG: chromosomal replication initiator protein DnaA [Ignavibacteriaceae bacterium]MBW7873707.1 chromosomal replication initiator protein DnaA [Ignavibacteria bacterium]MCZ2143932.1 chromosomal replication initiator protein DnaA [Ignavibacteriales bacterium]OQY78263.1 MAG: chromosomal replication initiation protein DnaA [Ignavibacteriales bacterium UTCHB3]MBV6444608.1 Chromosomal replication initiator protein DnaA [Ignavibacteriaceae bacterium]